MCPHVEESVHTSIYCSYELSRNLRFIFLGTSAGVEPALLIESKFFECTLGQNPSTFATFVIDAGLKCLAVVSSRK